MLKKFLASCAVLLAASGLTTKAQEKTAVLNPAPATRASVSESADERTGATAAPAVAARTEESDDATPRSPQSAGHSPSSDPARSPPATIETPHRDRLDLSAPPRTRAADDEETADESVEDASDESGEDASDEHGGDLRGRRFHWSPAVKQSLLFLGGQHGYAFTQPKTRRDLRGPFFRDYFRSVKSLGKWEDGGRFFTNYVAHPMQGSLFGFIWVQNDPRGKSARFGRSEAYWKSRLKATAWSAAWSTQFEIGPVSQASLGNVGLHGKQTWVDIVITPTGGTVWLVAEDAIDKYLIERIERGTDNFYVRIAGRMILNPTRTIANLLRFKKPWHRDAGLR